ncbi:MAG: DNA mismatch repair protein MutS, partial [Deltaproteobacteria bacterium]|nr:DNA mismatch repair protein MutS [Deltaproteobacteria bacterium]
PVTRGQVRDLLRQVPDLERLSARASAGRASPRDLGAIGRALDAMPELRARVASEPRLAPFADRLDPLPGLAAVLGRALVDDPPVSSREGGIIRRGYDPEVDRLAAISGGAKETLSAIELRERERTGIGSLKVRYNKVFGYFIEVTRTHLAKVPADYIRKQTIATGERFVTEELKRLEEEIFTANDRRIDRELELFEQLCEQVNAAGRQLRATAAAIGELDALAGLAEIAARQNYVRPRFHEDDDLALAIEEGRHPVVEQFSRELGESFVPNSIRLDCRERQILIVTGPNMAGKSTVMRQVALIQILAQAGSFVPAQSARLPLCDRVFTRVGASDDVSRGRSTFMVEMIETARILSGATRRSLVLLDEIGRGTSTFDGLAIAWAVAEHLHDAIGAKTLFATHYHELTDLSRVLPRVKNVHVAVKEWNDQVLFLRRLLDGAAERSYGIQVARLANLPESVLDRAKEVLVNLERAELDSENMPTFSQSKQRRAQVKQLGLFDPPPAVDALRDRLAKIDPEATAPLEALTLLAELKKLARE